MDDHGSPGWVGAVDQGTTSKVREVASSFPSETNASSPSVWRAGDKGPVIARPDRSGSACESRLGQSHSSKEGKETREGFGSDVRVELLKAQNAAAVPPLDVQIQQCELFISRSERRLAEIDAQRLAEEESLTGGCCRK